MLPCLLHVVIHGSSSRNNSGGLSFSAEADKLTTKAIELLARYRIPGPLSDCSHVVLYKGNGDGLKGDGKLEQAADGWSAYYYVRSLSLLAKLR